jgi:hypothetical protein
MKEQLRLLVEWAEDHNKSYIGGVIIPDPNGNKKDGNGHWYGSRLWQSTVCPGAESAELTDFVPVQSTS